MEFIVKYWLEVLFGVMVTGLTLAYRKLAARVKRQEAVEMGIQALLRDRMIQAYNHYSEKKYCPIYARENVEELYSRYHALGGNGTVSDLMDKLRELPTEKTE